MVREEGGATEGLINHAWIVIDFLLKGACQTLNYVFVHMRCPLKARHPNVAGPECRCIVLADTLHIQGDSCEVFNN